MTRSACEQFGDEFLSDAERTDIFDSILSGPPKERYLGYWGEEFTEERFEQRKRLFHRMQLRPFASLLFGSYTDYFLALESEQQYVVSDDDYMLIGDSKSGPVLSQSPFSPEDFAGMTDSELLHHINQWDEEFWYTTGEGQRGSFIEVNVEGLADTYGTYFREHILLDDARLGFWMENLHAIERSIYVRAVVAALDEYVKQGNLDRIEESLQICEWVLSHPDDGPSDSFRDGEQSRGASHWHSSRRAVEDFVETCLNEGSNVPAHVNQQLAELLDMLCTQSDWRLDTGDPVRIDRFDPYDSAINNTRSRALRSLILYGLRLKSDDPKADTSFVTNLLQRRFAPDAEYPLTLPEYGILGENFVRLLSLDRT